MKACKPITKESSQKFTDGRSKKEGYSFLRPVLTLSFQNKPRRVWGWRAGRGVGGAVILGKGFHMRACHTHTHTDMHTHTHTRYASAIMVSFNLVVMEPEGGGTVDLEKQSVSSGSLWRTGGRKEGRRGAKSGPCSDSGIPAAPITQSSRSAPFLQGTFADWSSSRFTGLGESSTSL